MRPFHGSETIAGVLAPLAGCVNQLPPGGETVAGLVRQRSGVVPEQKNAHGFPRALQASHGGEIRSSSRP